MVILNCGKYNCYMIISLLFEINHGIINLVLSLIVSIVLLQHENKVYEKKLHK